MEAPCKRVDYEHVKQDLGYGIGKCSTFKLTYEDEHLNQYDLLKKARQDFIKNDKNEFFPEFQDKLGDAGCNLVSLVSHFCPCIRTTNGILTFQIKVAGNSCTTSLIEGDAVVQCDDLDATAPLTERGTTGVMVDKNDLPRTVRDTNSSNTARLADLALKDNDLSTSTPRVESGAMVQDNGVEIPAVSLDKLRVAPRLMLGSNVCCTAQLAPFIELRQNTNEAVNDGAERSCDVGDAVMFMKNEKIYGDRFYGQATLTPTTPGTSFVDLNPHTPLPLLTNLPDHLLTEAISGNCRGWLLGQGGFGKVDMLECPRWAVADKKINLGMTPTTLKYAELEAEIMASVDHPNIVSYITSGPDKQCNNFHIIMEWMSGGSLKDEIEKYGPFRDKSVIIQRVHDLLTGLAHLHESNIVHRDLKADNLMIGEHGELKIGDFGHARRLINGAVEANSVEGTVYYMAPEYVRTQQFTKACDIWSVGAVALEMVTGRPPWMHSKQQPQDTFASLFFKIGGTKSPPEIPDDLPWDLRDFCQRCLELDPSKRPSAAELLCHPLFKVSPCYGSTEKLTETLPAVGLVVDVESACGNALLLMSPEC